MGEMHKELARLRQTRELIERAIVAETALEWLRRYGPTTASKRDTIAGCVTSQNYAGSCSGATEAREYLDRAIQHLFGDIGRCAVEFAERDIEAARSTLSPANRGTPDVV